MTDGLPEPGSGRHRGYLVGALIGFSLAVEGLLQLGDIGVIGIPRFRETVYEFGGFWPGLLDNWQQNYPFQRWLMFLTYGFLHAGILHLSLNMLTLYSLSGYVIQRVGGAKFTLLYAASILGGGIGFALLANTYRPMVGASGALFGLAGAILAWEYIDRFSLQERLWPVARAVLLLAALNVALYFAMDRLLAWEAHLGGFLVGWMMALLIDPRSR